MGDPVEFTDIFVDESIVDRATAVLRSGRYVKGPVLDQFEDEFAAFCGTDHAVGVSSGTDALSLAMEAADVGRGEDVFVPSHTFFATVSPVLERGARPVFVDVEPETYTMDPRDLTDAIAESENPAAVVPVHIYGHPAEMDAIGEIARRHDLTVIEDACQAHGARYRGQRAGSLGDVSCFSFYPSKNMTVAGDGGMVVTDDETFAEDVRQRRNHGRNEAGEHVTLGLNHRLSELHAAVGREQLDHVDEWNTQRQAVAAQYDRRLAEIEQVTVPSERSNVDHVYHLYVVRVPDRTDLQASLSAAEIETGVHYDPPVHRQPPIRERLDDVRPLPRTEALAEEILSLPMHPRMTDTEVETVCKTIEHHYDE